MSAKPASKPRKNHPEERDSQGRFLPRHAAYSRQMRQRYTDKRTKEGKQLHAVLDSLIEDLGGHDNLTAGQRLLLDTIKSKLIVVLQVGKYVDQQPNIIKDGELLPVLGKSYLSYLNSLRLAIEALYKDNGKAKTRVPSIREIIQSENK